MVPGDIGSMGIFDIAVAPADALDKALALAGVKLTAEAALSAMK